MKDCEDPMKTRSLLAVAFAVAYVCAAGAEEWRPVAVSVSGETTPSQGAEAMIDGDLSTWASLLDDTRGGKDSKTLPPNGDSPVTATFVLDAGAVRATRGMRLVAQPSRWLCRLPHTLTVFACSDPAGKCDSRTLIANVTLPVIFCGDSAFIEWPLTMSRYFGVRVTESCECAIRGLGNYREWVSSPLRAWGHPESGYTGQYVTDIAEVSLFDALPADKPVANVGTTAFPLWRLEKDWLMQDCGIDRFTQAFVTDKNADFERELIAKVAKELGITMPTLPDGICGRDPRCRAICLDLCAKRRAKRLAKLVAQAPAIIYTKHYTMGGDAEASVTAVVTDDLSDGRLGTGQRGARCAGCRWLPTVPLRARRSWRVPKVACVIRPCHLTRGRSCSRCATPITAMMLIAWDLAHSVAYRGASRLRSETAMTTIFTQWTW